MTTLNVYRRPFRRDPFAEFDTLVRSAFGPAATGQAGFSPAAEIVREGEDAVVRLELPGVDVDKDVAVALEDNRLVIRGERRDEFDEQRGERSIRELRYGSFERSFALPKRVVADQITASYDAGILSIRVAGVHAGPESTRIAVTTGTSAPAPDQIEG